MRNVEEMTISEKIASFCSGLRSDHIPDEVLAGAKLLFLDALGTAMAATPTEWGRLALEFGRSLSGPPESSILGSSERVGVAAAALVNGSLVHTLDFDDTYFGAIVHPSCFVVPAALATAERCSADGKTMITAIVAGYETVLRLARAGLDNLFRDNFHTTGLLGPMGAAVAAARAMNLDKAATANAIGIAAGLGGGILQAMREGQHAKALQAGYAAHGGVMAAMLASTSLAGPRAALEGELGFYRTYLGDDRYDLDKATEGLGQNWLTPDISIKMYPGAHRHHFFVESALHIQRKHNVQANEIAEICCISSPVHHYYNFNPEGYRPPNEHAARFSVPFLVAAALTRGQLDVQSFSPNSIADEVILALASRVTYRVEDGAEKPEKRGHIIMTLHDGRSFENIQSYIRGLPENPATAEDVRAKFKMNVGPVLGVERTSDLIRLADQLENLEARDLAGVVTLCRTRR